MERNYDQEVVLFFMCGIQEEWEKEIKSVRPDVYIRWDGPHVASVSSETKPVVHITREIREKLYNPIKDIFPCIEYCRVEVLDQIIKGESNEI